MGDRHRTGKSLEYVTGHPGQLSLLPSAGRETTTGESAMMLCCGAGVKAGMACHGLIIPRGTKKITRTHQEMR